MEGNIRFNLKNIDNERVVVDVAGTGGEIGKLFLYAFAHNPDLLRLLKNIIEVYEENKEEYEQSVKS